MHVYIKHICQHIYGWALAKRAGSSVLCVIIMYVILCIFNIFVYVILCIFNIFVCTYRGGRWQNEQALVFSQPRISSRRFSMRCVCCCSVLQCVAVCCSVLQCVAVCYSVLQYVAVCCSVLQFVTMCCTAVSP